MRVADPSAWGDEQGGRLLALVRARELSQSELSRRMGVCPGTVSSWVRGESAPNYSSIVLLSRALGLSAGHLMAYLVGEARG